MAEMVASALVQEGVSGAVSFVVSNREEKASQGHLLERLEMACSELESALERCSNMPILQVSLLRRRMMLKHAFQECHELLHKHKLLGDEEAEQGTVSVPSPLRRKIMHAVEPSLWSFSSRKKDLLCRSDVARFEWFAEKANKFVRAVESGCSLAHYRFFNPLITQLLEGKSLMYTMEQGSKVLYFDIDVIPLEEHGVVASLLFGSTYQEAPMKNFRLWILLRLSESTDIVGIVSTICLQLPSLGPQFKSAAEAAVGELAQITTQFHVTYRDPASTHLLKEGAVLCRPDPLCCTTNGLKKFCANNTHSSELTSRFPEQLMCFIFWFNISASEYNLGRSTDEAQRKTIKEWSYLQLETGFYPHISLISKNFGPLHQIEEKIQTEAIDYLSCQPEHTEYEQFWSSGHGCARFVVKKVVNEFSCAPKIIDKPKIRRVSKRKR